MSGNVAPETVNPLPVSDAEFTIRAAVPVEVSVIDCVTSEPTFTLPKVKEELLALRVGTDAANCTAKLCAALPALAVSVTFCAEVTEEIVAVKPAVLAPAGTFTDAGTVTALLLLARLTVNPPEAAAAFNVTTQLSVPAPVIEPLVQLRAESTGTPEPLRLITDWESISELLLMIN